MVEPGEASYRSPGPARSALGKVAKLVSKLLSPVRSYEPFTVRTSCEGAGPTRSHLPGTPLGVPRARSTGHEAVCDARAVKCLYQPADSDLEVTSWQVALSLPG